MNRPDFRLLTQYKPTDTTVVDFETTYIDEHGNVDKIWMIGWLWWEEGQRRTLQLKWPSGITPENLATLVNNVHSRAQIRGNRNDILLSHLVSRLAAYPSAYHNAGFDKRMLDRLNIPVLCYHDTMMITYLTLPPATLVKNVGDEDKLELYKLAELGRRGICSAKGDSPDFAEYSEEMGQYNLGDLHAEADLVERLLPIIYQDLDLADVYVNIEMPAIELAMVMSRRGVHIPDAGLDQAIIESEQEVEHHETTLQSYMPVLPNPNKPKEYVKHLRESQVVLDYESHEVVNLGKYVYVNTQNLKSRYREIIEFNPNSPTHKRHALKHLFNWESSRKSKKTGESSVDKHALKELQEDVQHPFVNSLITYGKHTKLLNNFLVPWKDGRDQHNRIHPRFIAVGTVTGRYSSRGPNFQNIPTSVKAAITAETGNVIVYVDLSQAELRLLAYYMAVVLNDYQLWNVYARDEDIHDYNMALMGITNPDQRVIAKRAIFTKIYGGGPGVLAMSCDISREKAKYYLAKFAEVIPGIGNLETAVSDAILQSNDHALRTLGGRKILYPDYVKYYRDRRNEYKKARAFRQYFNALFQGSNFDITSQLLWEAYPYALEAGGTPIIQVHDSGVFEVAKPSAGYFADHLYRIFNRSDILGGLPIKGMPGIGHTWLEAEKDAKTNEDKEKEAKKCKS